MERTSLLERNIQISKSTRREGSQIDYIDYLNVDYKIESRLLHFEKEENPDYWRTPYTIEEIVAIRKKIDGFLVFSNELAARQSVSLLEKLYKKTTFKMALLTLFRSKPIATVRVIGLLIMVLSLIAFLLNILFKEPLVSPYLILYFFYFGLLMAGMALIEKAQRKKHKISL